MCAMESFIKEMETAINNRKKMDLVIQLQRITHELWSSVMTGNYIEKSVDDHTSADTRDIHQLSISKQ